MKLHFLEYITLYEVTAHMRINDNEVEDTEEKEATNVPRMTITRLSYAHYYPSLGETETSNDKGNRRPAPVSCMASIIVSKNISAHNRSRQCQVILSMIHIRH